MLSHALEVSSQYRRTIYVSREMPVGLNWTVMMHAADSMVYSDCEGIDPHDTHGVGGHGRDLSALIRSRGIVVK
jgi:hypothetical protein